MKTINESFSPGEFSKLTKAKEKAGLNWHDFIMKLAEPEGSP